MSKNIFIVGAKRTAFGKFGGKLKDINSTELQVIANKAAIEQSKLSADKIDTVIVGNIIPTSTDAGYISRHSALKSGVSQGTPALTINRLCGSGFQSIVNGAQEILLGDAKTALCGGVENMSLAPYSTRGNRFGVRLGENMTMEDTLWASLTDSYVSLPMAITAENLAEIHKISRKECDEYALQSQQRWQAAHNKGHFVDEIVAIKTKSKKGETSFEVDEHARGNVTLEDLSKLPAVFKKNGVVTAGNASGICDGAGAIVLADEETVKRENLTPLARFAGYHVSGCDPKIMGIGPVPAIINLLKKSKLTIEQIDLVDVSFFILVSSFFFFDFKNFN
jgi:acetyl-CoA acyltransferase 2